ncbi:hypothetical protein [Bacillus cereus group sp. MYBK216-1]|uniref:hypothetical protein n=1 Tax=Bacillus cereus group sp. MYBK216-1 TaxID=3450663 RepID=UPI003F791DE8
MLIVAPYIGAWIEITNRWSRRQRNEVAPYVGAWIEVLITYIFFQVLHVAPQKVPGLKLAMLWF